MLQNPALAKRSGKSGRDLTRRVVYELYDRRSKWFWKIGMRMKDRRAFEKKDKDLLDFAHSYLSDAR